MKSFVEIFLSYFSVSRSRIFRFRFVIFSWLYKFIFVANHIVRTITVNYRIQVTQWQNWRWLVSLMRALQSNAIHYDNLFLRNCVDVHSTQSVWVFHSKCICNSDQLCASNIVFLMKIYKTGKNMKICAVLGWAANRSIWYGMYWTLHRLLPPTRRRHSGRFMAEEKLLRIASGLIYYNQNTLSDLRIFSLFSWD